MKTLHTFTTFRISEGTLYRTVFDAHARGKAAKDGVNVGVSFKGTHKGIVTGYFINDKVYRGGTQFGVKHPASKYFNEFVELIAEARKL